MTRVRVLEGLHLGIGVEERVHVFGQTGEQFCLVFCCVGAKHSKAIFKNTYDELCLEAPVSPCCV